MSHIYKIALHQVEIGMFVSELTPKLQQSGLNARGLISRQETLNKLRVSGLQHIYIDVQRGKGSIHALPVPDSDPPLKSTKTLQAERERAAKVYSEARSLVGSLVGNVKMGKPIEVGPVKQLAEDISESLHANHNALLCLSQIREKDLYLLEHSINVGILMGVFVRYLGYERAAMQEMITGALLHDIGKIKVPYHVLNKPGKLNDSEWELMRKHVELGEEVLNTSAGISDVAKAVCAQHHEKLNGKGYPRGLSAEQISVSGRLAAIVDIYDALTADRVYHQGRSPFEVMRLLSQMAKDGELDRELVYEFIRCMSVYPVGTLVEIDTGRLAVVVQSNERQADKPLLKQFYNLRFRHYEAPRFVDLAGTDTRIVRVHDPREYGIEISEVI